MVAAKKAPAKGKPKATATKRKLTIAKQKYVCGGQEPKSERATRRLFRRSSDEQAERAMRLKLGCYPQVQLNNNTDDDGRGVLENTKREQNRVRLAKKHMTLALWQGLVTKHKLSGGVCDLLPAPQVEE